MTPSASNDEQGNQGGADAALAQRLNQAEIVIAGTATSTAALEAPRPPFVSEHAPEWWQATIAVESVEKGKVAGSTINVLYNNSSDVSSYRMPKISKGQQGVFLLQKDSSGKLAVLDPLDSRPIGDLDKIRALLKGAAKK